MARNAAQLVAYILSTISIMVTQAYNPSIWQVDEQDQKFKVILGYTASLRQMQDSLETHPLKKKKR